MPKVSVIIPVYKAERFLHRCVDSLLNQTFTDFEIILVDDGSPDGSGKICDEYADKHSFIRVFHTENGGVSSARNYGITQAKGEWVCFVDSDDFVTENYLEDFFRTGELQSNVLYVQKGFYRYDSRSKKTEYRGITGDIPLYGANSFIQGEFYHILNSPWMKLFNRQMIIDNSLVFDSALSLGEDHVYVLDYLLSDNVAGVRILEGSGYRYVKFENENSLTARIKPYKGLVKYAVDSYDKRLKLIERYGISDESFIGFIKIETKTYRLFSLLSLVSKEGYSKKALASYRDVFILSRPFKYVHTSKYCGLRPFIGLFGDISPYWLNYILFPLIYSSYRLTAKLIRKLI